MENKTNSTVSELLEQIQAGVKTLCQSDNYRNYLKVMSSFPSYSANNVMLIFSQCPSASFICGFRSWQKNFHRHVKKGEKAIRIIAPVISEISEEDGSVRKIIRYRRVNVFDISQTEGEPLPELEPLATLDGNVEEYSTLLDTLCDISPFSVDFRPLKKGVHGKTVYFGRKIEISDQLTQKQTIKTLLHEIAHSYLHDLKSEVCSEYLRRLGEEPGLRELEAESVAYVVSSSLGLDVADYSFSYVARWSRGEEFPKEALNRICNLSSRLIEQIKAHKEETKHDKHL